jgi:hypothetical protein
MQQQGTPHPQKRPSAVGIFDPYEGLDRRRFDFVRPYNLRIAARLLPNISRRTGL